MGVLVSSRDSVYLIPPDLGLWGSSFLTQMSPSPHVGAFRHSAGLLHDCQCSQDGLIPCALPCPGMPPMPQWPSLWPSCYSLCLRRSPSSTSAARLRKVRLLSWPLIHQSWGPGSKGSPWCSLGLGGRTSHPVEKDWLDYKVWAQRIFQAFSAYCLVQNLLFCFLNI